MVVAQAKQSFETAYGSCAIFLLILTKGKPGYVKDESDI
jgi:hypothetical protein